MKLRLLSRFRWTFIAFAVLPILLAAIGISAVVWRLHIDTEHARLQELASRVSNAMDSEMRRGEKTLMEVQHYRNLVELSAERLELVLAEMVLRERSFNSATFIDSDGDVRARASNTELLTGELTEDRRHDEAFISVMDSRTTYYGPVRFDKIESAPLMTVAIPVADIYQDQVSAVMIAEVRLRTLWQLLARLSPGSGTHVYMTNDSGRVIAHANPSIVLRDTYVQARGHKQTATGLFGNTVYWAQHSLQLGNQGFRVIAERDWIPAIKPVLGSLLVLAIVLAIALLAATAAGMLFARRVISPVLAIEATARAITAGDLQKRVDLDVDNELGTLASSFNYMTEHLQRTLQQLGDEINVHRLTQEDLQRTRDTLRSIIDTVPIAIFWKDCDLRYIGCNRIFARDAGYNDADDIIGKKDSELVWSSHASTYTVDDLDVINSGQPKLAFEELTIQMDGLPRWIRTSKVPLYNNEKQVIGVLGIYMDITEQKKAREALRHLNEELEDRVEQRTEELVNLNRELESFSYSVSHDLRAPLRSIDGFAQALAEDYQDKLDDDGRDFIKRIRSAAQRMGQLIDDMLLLSRVTRQEVSMERVDLSKMCLKILQNLQHEQPDRNVRIVIAPNLIAYGDRNLLHVALLNLLENAWKYTGKQPRAYIEVGCRQDDKGPVFFVRDDGVGFDMAYTEKLFRPFHRMHVGRDFPGTGIGLATVKRVILRHGGQIWAEATVDVGTTFYFTLGKSQD